MGNIKNSEKKNYLDLLTDKGIHSPQEAAAAKIVTLKEDIEIKQEKLQTEIRRKVYQEFLNRRMRD